jgi:hypothetical protein
MQAKQMLNSNNQVARRDIRVCHFAGKIFTLPLDFQMLLSQLFLETFMPSIHKRKHLLRMN